MALQGDGVVEAAGFSVRPGEELMHAGSNSRLLNQLNGGKTFLSRADQALDRSGLLGDASTELHPLWGYFVAPALVLLLFSVAARRVDFGRRSASV